MAAIRNPADNPINNLFANLFVLPQLFKLLLGYLPANKGEWDSILTEKRKAYEQFVTDFILSEKANTQTNDHVSRGYADRISGLSPNSFVSPNLPSH